MSSLSSEQQILKTLIAVLLVIASASLLSFAVVYLYQLVVLFVIKTPRTITQELQTIQQLELEEQLHDKLRAQQERKGKQLPLRYRKMKFNNLLDSQIGGFGDNDISVINPLGEEVQEQQEGEGNQGRVQKKVRWFKEELTQSDISESSVEVSKPVIRQIQSFLL